MENGKSSMVETVQKKKLSRWLLKVSSVKRTVTLPKQFQEAKTMDDCTHRLAHYNEEKKKETGNIPKQSCCYKVNL